MPYGISSMVTIEVVQGDNSPEPLGVTGKMKIPCIFNPALGCVDRVTVNVIFNRVFYGCFNTPLEHTPKPLPTGYNGIPFIVGQGDCLGCALGVCCDFLGGLH